MKAIYEPAGKAREYADLACNLYRGCVHGCKYCFAPAVLHMTADNFHARAQLRPGILEALAKEAPAYRGEPRRVQVLESVTAYHRRLRQVPMSPSELVAERGRRTRRAAQREAQGPAVELPLEMEGCAATSLTAAPVSPVAGFLGRCAGGPTPKAATGRTGPSRGEEVASAREGNEDTYESNPWD